MAFNLKRAKVCKQDEKASVKRARRQGLDKKFVVYIIRFHKIFDHPQFDKRFRIMVWSKVDRRYVCDVDTNQVDTGLDRVLKEYKKKNSIVIDLRDVPESVIVEKYRLR